MSVVAIILAGAVFATADAALAPTADGRLVYVARVDCVIGSGWLRLSKPDGSDMHRGPFFVLGASDTASTAATLLCKEFP
jgi:hypothetical protein